MNVVQTYVPRRAFDALDLPKIVQIAKLAGIDHPRVEYSTHKIPASIPVGSTRLTCSWEMALALVEAFKQQAARAEDRQDGELLIATAKAVAALLAAIEDSQRPPTTRGTEPTPY